MDSRRSLKKLAKKRRRVLNLLRELKFNAKGLDSHPSVIRAAYSALSLDVQKVTDLREGQIARAFGFYAVILSAANRIRKVRKRTVSAPVTVSVVPMVPQVALSDGFYESREWKSVRYRALKANDGLCELCGRGRHNGVVLHVDHIKPRSKFPHLALEVTNLQVLCGDCNLGKGNKDDTDWRGRDDGPRLITLMGERMSGLD